MEGKRWRSRSEESDYGKERPVAEEVFNGPEPIKGNPFFDEGKIYQAACKTKTEAVS